LVVIAIIGVLVGILLPAVQSARESSRKSDCLSRIRQLALALSNHETSHGRLPAGSVAQADPKDPATPHTFYRWSAFAQILPYLEASQVRAQLDLTLPMYRKDFSVPVENQPALALVLPSLLCPSDRGDRVNPMFGPTNYAACTGSGNDGGSPFTADGVFYTNSQTRLADIVDGTSRTAILAECILGQPNPIPARTLQSQVDERFAYVFASAAPLNQAACDRSMLYNFTDPPGYSWANGEFRCALYNHFRTPNSPELDCSSAKLLGPISDRYAGFGWKSARSLHAAGVNVALADGSARSVTDGVDPTVWRALSTRHGE
jgi:type II secretory pathway pseudopilin PulG